MIKATFKYFLASLLFLIISVQSDAQKADKYIYKDSSILYSKDKVIDTMVVQESKEDDFYNTDKVSNNTETAKPDTTFISNKLFITKQNVRNLKNEKQLAYAQNLDSLLKDLQQKKAAGFTATTNRFSSLIRFFSAPLTKIIFWTLAALLIVFIIVKLFFAEGFFLRRSATNFVKPLEEEEKYDPVSIDYSRLLKQAISNKDYRLATRYLYLQSLQQLIIAGAIIYSQDKTNYQYLMEINNQPYRQEFSLLTLHYEYAWYGDFLMNEAGFTALQKKFTSFNKQV